MELSTIIIIAILAFALLGSKGKRRRVLREIKSYVDMAYAMSSPEAYKERLALEKRAQKEYRDEKQRSRDEFEKIVERIEEKNRKENEDKKT